MLIRRERPDDVDAIREVAAVAFAREPGKTPGEAPLIDHLRASDAWLPPLSLVATGPDGEVIGHVVCSRGDVDGRPAVGLGPLAVRPGSQKRGVGSALMHAVLGAADALGEPAVILLGDPRYYSRFGFELASSYGIAPEKPEWRPDFQVRTLASYTPELAGTFKYAAPFGEV